MLQLIENTELDSSRLNQDKIGLYVTLKAQLRCGFKALIRLSIIIK
jgi:hypothetical protein